MNDKLRNMDITLLGRRPQGEFDFSGLTPDDVVIMPAFGVTMSDFERLRAIECVLVDTTCGSVLNVWKRVESYARDGYTAIIHGKHYHEETKATASQVMKYPEGRYLVVFDMQEARLICDFIEHAGDVTSLRGRFGPAVSPGFDFHRDLNRVGLANQTTMLSGESLAIAAEVRQSMIRRHGEHQLDEHFRSFDTICSATQERQDAVMSLLQEQPAVMIVVGGYNSSNTCHLAALAHHHGVPTYHVEDADAVDVTTGTIRYQPIGSKAELVTGEWLGNAGTIGITAGASTQQGGRDYRENLRGSGATPGGRDRVQSPLHRPESHRRARDDDLSRSSGASHMRLSSREQSRALYAQGVEFQIGKIEMVANTGTYLDSPFHRYRDGMDLSQLSLERVADLEAVVVRYRLGKAGRSRPNDSAAWTWRTRQSWSILVGPFIGEWSVTSPGTHSSQQRPRRFSWMLERCSSE